MIKIGKPVYVFFRYLKKYIVPVGLITFLLGGSYWFYFEIIKELPDVNIIYNTPRLSTRILDRNGNLLYKFYENENRSWVPLERIPRTLINATISIEDKDFYQHRGISIKGVTKAVAYNIKNSKDTKPRGGSTITQQLAKNIFFNSEKSLKRKIKEAILTIAIESKLNKKEILERYFNQVPYGGEAYGVQEASLKYFGKNVWELSAAESAYLAGLPAAPTSYSPYGSSPEFGFIRQKHVIDEMVNANYISQEEADSLIKEEIKIIKPEININAPHFVFFIKQILEQQLQLQNFERQGLSVYTSLDLNVQKEAETVVKEELEKVKKLNISNGAALVLDVKSGEILAMVGSKDYFASDIDGKYNVTTALRQPGSSIKPINYLLALQKGFGLSSIIEDSPVTYQIAGQKPYSPKNYNGKYMGRITLKTALASSLNVPSVKLLSQNGVNNMIDLAELMGITTWSDRKRYGLSLALGSGEVKMLEIASAYSVFANLGQKIEVEPILKIENYLGRIIYEKDYKKTEVIRPEHAYLINSALSDNNARAPIFGINSKLLIPGKTVAVKTGTTNNLKDNWCIGWTPSYLVAAWVGNNGGQPMSWVASGVSGATPIWNNIMNGLLKDKNDENWYMPSNIVKRNVCNKEELLIAGNETNIKCIIP